MNRFIANSTKLALRYWLGALCIYAIAVTSAMHCYNVYTGYLQQAQQSATMISFQTNFYLLLIPLAFITTHIFGLIQVGLVNISKTKVRYETLAFCLGAAVFLLSGYAWQQRMTYEIRRQGYVDCLNMSKRDFHSPTFVFAKSANNCWQKL